MIAREPGSSSERERMRSVYVCKSQITLIILTDSEEKIKIHREFSTFSGAL